MNSVVMARRPPLDPDELRDGLDFVIVARPAAGELAEREGEKGVGAALQEVLAAAGLAEGPA